MGKRTSMDPPGGRVRRPRGTSMAKMATGSPPRLFFSKVIYGPYPAPAMSPPTSMVIYGKKDIYGGKDIYAQNVMYGGPGRMRKCEIRGCLTGAAEPGRTQSRVMTSMVTPAD